MFVRHGIALGGAGVVCGAAAAALLTRLIASLLYGTSPLDPTIHGLVSLGLIGITALASYVPAHGATRVDPVQTLRGQQTSSSGSGAARSARGPSAQSL